MTDMDIDEVETNNNENNAIKKNNKKKVIRRDQQNIPWVEKYRPER